MHSVLLSINRKRTSSLWSWVSEFLIRLTPILIAQRVSQIKVGRSGANNTGSRTRWGPRIIMCCDYPGVDAESLRRHFVPPFSCQTIEIMDLRGWNFPRNFMLGKRNEWNSVPISGGTCLQECDFTQLWQLGGPLDSRDYTMGRITPWPGLLSSAHPLPSIQFKWHCQSCTCAGSLCSSSQCGHI